MIVYLCGPINGCTDEEATNWRENFKTCWPYKTLDPMRRDYRGKEDESVSEIVVLDKLDVRNSDVILVNYSKPSVGTSMEIFYAHGLGKPVVLWSAKDTSLSPWLRYHATTIVHSAKDAVRACLRLG